MDHYDCSTFTLLIFGKPNRVWVEGKEKEVFPQPQGFFFSSHDIVGKAITIKIMAMIMTSWWLFVIYCTILGSYTHIQFIVSSARKWARQRTVLLANCELNAFYLVLAQFMNDVLWQRSQKFLGWSTSTSIILPILWACLSKRNTRGTYVPKALYGFRARLSISSRLLFGGNKTKKGHHNFRPNNTDLRF